MLEAAEAEAAAAPNAPGARVGVPAGRLRPARHARPRSTSTARYADLRPAQGGPAPPRSAAPASACNPSLASGLERRPEGPVRRAARSACCPASTTPNPDLSHFHSRHFWETGLITEEPRPAGSAAGSTAPARRDNPLQGVSMDYGALARAALRPARRWPRSPRPATPASGSATSGATPSTSAMAAYGAHRRGAGGGRGAGRGAATRRAAGQEVADRLAPYAEHDGVDPLASTVAYPRGATSASACATSRR